MIDIIKPAEIPQEIMLLPMESRYNRYIDGRNWRRKTRSFKTNFRSSNKKKNNQFCNR